jgi:transcriptional regulator with XRE-family HTH domain
MPTSEEIRQYISAYERDLVERVARSRTPAKRRGRPQTARTRQKLSQIAFNRFRTASLADAESRHPLTLARLRHEPPLSAAALAERALVGESLVRKIEAGHTPSRLTLRRLARALRVPESQLRR